MKIAVRAGIVATVYLSAGCAVGIRGGATPGVHQSRAIVGPCSVASSEPSRFTFRSSFWLNLHNYLFQEAKRARGIRDDARNAFPDPFTTTSPMRELRPAERERWARAVSVYAESIVSGPHPDSVVIRVNDRLARSDSVPELEPELFDGRLLRALLDAAPVYREVWWAGHDAQNHRWIAEMRGYLERYESCLAGRMAAQLGGGWPSTPIQVNATVYASWFGAYTTFAPPLITMSTTAVGNQGASGLESLFHEAGHVMLGPLETAIREAARETELAPDPNLSHLLLFYTAGDLVWRAIPDHPTNAARFGVWTQNGRARELRQVIAREWRPWLDGARPMDDAIRSLLGARVVVGSE